MFKERIRCNILYDCLFFVCFVKQTILKTMSGTMGLTECPNICMNRTHCFMQRFYNEFYDDVYNAVYFCRKQRPGRARAAAG